MNAERHARIKEIYLEVLAAPPDDRVARLRTLCGGDRELREEVESLLEYAEPTTVRSGPQADDATAFLPGGDPGVEPRGAQVVRPVRSGEMLAPGALYAGRFRIVSLLGAGGMGEVYEAHDRVLDESVALKRLVDRDASSRRRILEEARLARRITHPAICRVHDVGEAPSDRPGSPEIFLSMERVSGETLTELLRRVRRLPEETVVDLARQILVGLAAAHAAGVVHRDLKPSNIMLDRDGRVRITDFGVAVLGDVATRGVVGTPGYMSPEQVGGLKADARSDLYSVGLVLREMVTGEAAYSGDSAAELLRRQARSEPTPPSRTFPDVDPALDRTLRRALERDPDRRYPSALAMASDLPGSNPLVLAAAAGVMPSPEQVADASPGPVPPPRSIGVTVTLLVLSMLALAFLADRAFRYPEVGFDRPPAVLAARAGEMLWDLGHRAEVADEAMGFLEDFWAEEPGDAVLFWHRGAAEAMVPFELTNAMFGGGRVDLGDPPVVEDGMSLVFLDGRERLSFLEVVPESETRRGPRLPEAQQDLGSVWETALGFAGLEAEKLKVAEPFVRPAVHADVWKAWKGELDGRPVDVHAAAVLGRSPAEDEVLEPGESSEDIEGARLVFFEVYPEVVDDDERSWDHSTRQIIANRLFYVLPLLALPFAVSNLREGRADGVGAGRLVAFVAGIRGLDWAVSAHHVGDLLGEIDLFLGLVASVATESLLLGTSYLALEPWVRRWYPHALIAWRRVLDGRFRDAAVGRSVLAGTAVGTFWAVLTAVDRWMPSLTGRPSLLAPVDPLAIEVAVRARDVVSNGLDWALSTTYSGLCLLVLFVVLRRFLPDPRVALAALMVVTVGLETLEGTIPSLSVVVLGLGIGITEALVLVRSGLLTLIAARFCLGLLLSSPLTLRFDLWFAPAGLLAVAAVLALGVWGGALAHRGASTVARRPAMPS